MSSTLLSSYKSTLKKSCSRRSWISIRNAGRKAAHADPQNELIRRVLYPSNLRNKETPTGTWRPDVAKALRRAIPSKQAHETVERAWLLHERHLRWKRDEEAERKFMCLRRAMGELEKTDPVLFKEANRVEDPRKRTEAEVGSLNTLRGVEKKAMEGRLPGLFPHEMRLPTDTPPRTGWNYDWKSSS
ncbi:hypothetical protein M0805_000946 [Coniferiporia weirii]|nr:hypothetical protein M0805_000946 [Coniferiporia weirii]